jgi:hypothetical protein
VASCVDNSGVGTRTCTRSRISQLRVFPMYDKITFGIVTSGKSFVQSGRVEVIQNKEVEEILTKLILS